MSRIKGDWYFFEFEIGKCVFYPKILLAELVQRITYGLFVVSQAPLLPFLRQHDNLILLVHILDDFRAYTALTQPLVKNDAVTFCLFIMSTCVKLRVRNFIFLQYIRFCFYFENLQFSRRVPFMRNAIAFHKHGSCSKLSDKEARLLSSVYSLHIPHFYNHCHPIHVRCPPTFILCSKCDFAHHLWPNSLLRSFVHEDGIEDEMGKVKISEKNRN